jgi:hypothetical protein
MRYCIEMRGLNHFAFDCAPQQQIKIPRLQCWASVFSLCSSASAPWPSPAPTASSSQPTRARAASTTSPRPKASTLAQPATCPTTRTTRRSSRHQGLWHAHPRQRHEGAAAPINRLSLRPADLDTIFALQWDSTEPQRGVFNYAPGDKFMALAKSTGAKVRCHTLVWVSLSHLESTRQRLELSTKLNI